MLVNLNLQGRHVLIIGGGKEAQKRAEGLLDEGCRITVLAKSASPRLAELARKGLITLKRQAVSSMRILVAYKPYMVMATTDDRALNQKIIKYAKDKKMIAYSSDDPESSDFANSAAIDFDDAIRIAVFTRGKSPSMAKRLRAKIENGLRGIITQEDVLWVKIQEAARKMAMDAIPSQDARKKFLAHIMEDVEIKQLIKEGRLKEAEDRTAAILRDLEWTKK